MQLKSLVKDFIQVELTTVARLPIDLENIMAVAVSQGLKDEDALEDAVMKIEMYRKLFGASSAPVGVSISHGMNGLNKFVDNILLEQKKVIAPEVINDEPSDNDYDDKEEEKHHKPAKKSVNF